MLRLALFPFVLIILLLLSAIVSWMIYRKLKKGIGYTMKKGAEIANDQQQKWAKKEQRKKHPDILQKGFSDYDKIYTLTTALPEEWRISLKPIVSTAKDILDEIALDLEEKEKANNKGAEEGKAKSSQTQRHEQNKKLNSIRSFFIHSLDALLQFVEKLSSDHQKMSADEIDKARQNINVFKADLLSHQETLHKARRFDFDVVMDVIKARLK